MEKIEKIINGVRNVMNPMTGEFMPDTIVDSKGITGILHEEKFLYYPYLEEIPPEEITWEERQEFLEMVNEAEMESARETKELGLSEADFTTIVPEEMIPEFYKTAQGYYKRIPQELQEQIPHGKYVTLRKEYLLKEQPEQYSYYKMTGQLNNHLTGINLQAHEMEDMIMQKLMENSQEYKTAEENGDYMTKIQLMNSFMKTAEEEILNEVIYR